jgi:LmbE family N-acetylglucosaminyl deacetylase
MRRALVIHAHPDDEVFATAATTLALHRDGAHVALRVATGGEAGEQAMDPSLDLDAARVARERRLDHSCELLGIAEWAYLTRPGEWRDRRTSGHDTVAAAPRSTLSRAVADAVYDYEPDLVLTVGPDGLTGHPDHIAIHDAVVEALRTREGPPIDGWGACLRREAVVRGQAAARAAVPATSVGSGRVVGVADEVIDHTVEIAPALSRRRRDALDCYVPGLGTLPLDELVAEYRGRGDSLLLRTVFDATTWGRDHLVRLGDRGPGPHPVG